MLSCSLLFFSFVRQPRGRKKRVLTRFLLCTHPLRYEMNVSCSLLRYDVRRTYDSVDLFNLDTLLVVRG